MTCRAARRVRPKCIRIWRMRVCREWRLRRTHEPCVPTGQMDSRMLMRRHNMTSLRSLYVPHGSLLPTTYYLLLCPPPAWYYSPKAPLLKSLAIGLCALSLSGNFLTIVYLTPHGVTHSSLLTTTYYLLTTT